MPIGNFAKLKWLCVFIFLFSLLNRSHASHIIGGDITYDFLYFNDDKTEATYEVTLVLYRDPTGVRLDDFSNFGVFSQLDDGSWESYKVVSMVFRDDILEHDPASDPCRSRFLNGEKLEYTNYTFELTLELSDTNYKIAFQKCCRNFTINNIFADGNIGAVYDVIITPESMRLGNSSPKFGPIPPLFVCSGFDLDIDHSATDSDGDQLVYKFCTPLHPGFDDGSSVEVDCCGCTNPNPAICLPDYPELVYEVGFSPQNPMRGDPQVTIDSETGVITGRPELLGPYVIVVCVEEYRDGELIGIVRRDFELNSIVCTEYLKAELESTTYLEDDNTGKSVAYYESCGDTRFSIVNLSRDEAFIKDYIWEVYNEEDQLVYNRSGLDSRDITLDLPGTGRYYGWMMLNDNVSCSDTALMEIFVAPELELDFDISYNGCELGPVQFISKNVDLNLIDRWRWDFGDGNNSELASPINNFDQEGTYTIKIEAEDIYGCSTTFEKDITYALVESHNTIISESICQNEVFEFQEGQYAEQGIYDFTFQDQFGCDSTVTLDLTIFPTSVFQFADTICKGDEYLFESRIVTTAGEYRETLTNSNGCDSVIILHLEVGENLTRLEVDGPIEMDFGDVITLRPIVEGGDLIYKQWHNTEFVLGNELELRYIVEKDDKIYFESINEIFCLAMDSVDIRSVINKGVYIPNIFSPNGDGSNDTFEIGFTKSVSLLDLKIFDRWGNLVFNNRDNTKAQISHWDGTINGDSAEVGVYVYAIQFEYVNGDRFEQQGSIQLVR